MGRRKGGSRCLHLWQHELGTGEANVIPGAMKITFDIRSVDQSLLEEAEALLAYLKAANGEKIKIGIEYLVKDDPIRMDDEGIAIMQKIADEEKYAYMLIDSGAGHDSQLFARYFKSNMIFCRVRMGLAILQKNLQISGGLRTDIGC